MSGPCPAPGTHSGQIVTVAVPPDLPAPAAYPTGDGPTLRDSGPVTATACEGHAAVVRMMLERQHAPRRSAYRDGRPT